MRYDRMQNLTSTVVATVQHKRIFGRQQRVHCTVYVHRDIVGITPCFDVTLSVQ